MLAPLLLRSQLSNNLIQSFDGFVFQRKLTQSQSYSTEIAFDTKSTVITQEQPKLDFSDSVRALQQFMG